MFGYALNSKKLQGIRIKKLLHFIIFFLPVFIYSPAFALPVLQSDVSAVPSVVSLGQDFTLINTVTNTGDQDADSVTPNPPIVSGTGCTIMLTSPSPASLTITAGNSGTFSWVYTATCAGSIYISVLDCSTVCSQPATATVTAQTPASLAAGLSAMPSMASIGQYITLIMTVTNTGQTNANNVCASNPAITGIGNAVLISSPSCQTITGSTVAYFTWTYSAGGAGNIICTASASGTDANSGMTITGNTPTSNMVTIQYPASLICGIDAMPDPVSINGMITVIMTVTNIGQAAAIIVMPFPFNLSGTGNVVIVAGPSPASAAIFGGSATAFTWIYTATGMGNKTFSGGAQGTDANSGANVSTLCSSNVVTIQPPMANLVINCTSLASPVSVGQNITVIISVSNIGGNTASNVQASAIAEGDASSVSLASGPNPASAAIMPGTGLQFTWVYNCIGTGTVSFYEQASGIDAIFGLITATPVTCGSVIMQIPTITPTFSSTATLTFTCTPTQTITVCTGEGSAVVNPTFVYSGSTGNTLVFTYTSGPTTWASSPGYGTLKITLRAGWSPPSIVPTDPGYFTVVVNSGSIISENVSGQDIIVEVSNLAANTGQITINYGDKSGGGPGAAAPVAPCPVEFGDSYNVESSPDSSITCPITSMGPWIMVLCLTPTSTPTPFLSPTNTSTITPTYTATLVSGPTPCYITQWGSYGCCGATAGNGQFDDPYGIAIDNSGNVYVVDLYNNRIQEFSSTGAYITQWGSNGSGNGQFLNPQGIAVDSSGNVYVTDVWSNRIQEFSSTGTYIAQWGSYGAGNGQLNAPHGVAIDSSGNVYVVDQGNSRIEEFNSTGTYITQWGNFGNGNGQFWNPWGIAVNSSGDVYVPDTDNNRIQEFSSTGTYITQWGSTGSNPGQFNYPWGIAVDSSGNVYVSEYGNNRIQEFSSTGTYITQWGSTGTGNGQFSFPEAVAVDSSGDVYVVDEGNDRIEEFGACTSPTVTTSATCTVLIATSTGTSTPTASVTCTVLSATATEISTNTPTETPTLTPTPAVSPTNTFTITPTYTATLTSGPTSCFITAWGSNGTGNGQFQGLYGIAVNSSGNVYVTDTSNYRIQEFSSTGTYITKWGGAGSGNGQFSGPSGIAVNSSGDVYVADTGTDRIQEFSSTGTYITQWGSLGICPSCSNGQFNQPYGIAVDSSGNVYVADTGNNRIQEFNSAGAYITQWGNLGSGNGQFNGPGGIAVDSSGNVYVSDHLNNRMQEFSSTGTYITQWGSYGNSPGQFNGPSGVAVDSTGNVYVVDWGNSRIQEFSSTGTYITQWGSTGNGNGQFSSPEGIAVDSSGNVYVADDWNNRIEEFGACASPTPTSSATATPTETITKTATPTATETNTSTSTPTFTTTSTNTATYTITPTFTITDTDTATLTITETFTGTPTYTISPTDTITLTQTPTPSITPTSTISPTITITPTPYANGDIIVYPNPFNLNKAAGRELKIINLPIGADIQIYTISGELVISLTGQTPNVYWNGRNSYGGLVSPGVYYYVIKLNSNILLTGIIFIIH